MCNHSHTLTHTPTPTNNNNRQGSLFFIAVQSMFGSCLGTLTVFGAEKAVFSREYGARMYSLPAYFSSRWCVAATGGLWLCCFALCVSLSVCFCMYSSSTLPHTHTHTHSLVRAPNNNKQTKTKNKKG